MQIPTAWNSFIGCHQCKRSIIEAIGLSFLKSIQFKLRTGQTLFLSGCFSGSTHNLTFRFSANSLTCPDSHYTSNSEEADIRIWRHVTQTQFDHILIHSPDTDVYNIGLPIVAENTTKQVIVQINLPQSASSLYIYLNNMLTALNLDPELAGLPHHKLPEIFQMLFMLRMRLYFLLCQIGEGFLFQCLFSSCRFYYWRANWWTAFWCITRKNSDGFFSFLEINRSTVLQETFCSLVSLRGIETPIQLFNAHIQSDNNTKTQHLLWYDDIRGIVSDRITCEQEWMPSHTSMWRH